MTNKQKKRDNGRRLVKALQPVFSLELQRDLELGEVVDLDITRIAPRVFDDGYLEIVGLSSAAEVVEETVEVTDGTGN